MMHGLATGAVDPRGLLFELVEGDIETLNRRALSGELEVTAISFAAYPRFASLYDLLPVGSSFGLGYGPKLVARDPLAPEELATRVVAIPGDMTSAAVTLRLYAPRVATRVLPFERIPEAVARGEADAGVVIHESQLTYARHGLALVRDLGAWWAEDTGGLPLPLGGNAIRRGLPDDVVRDVKAVLRESIEHALAHRRAAVAQALKPERGLSDEEGDRYVGLYVNELTLEAGERGRAAAALFYARAAAAGLLPAVEPRWA